MKSIHIQKTCKKILEAASMIRAMDDEDEEDPDYVPGWDDSCPLGARK